VESVLLFSSPLLVALSPDERGHLIEHLRIRRLARREWANHPGDPAPGLCWLHSGLVQVLHDRPGEPHVPLQILWPNEISPHGSAVSREWLASAIALIPTTLCFVRREPVQEALRESTTLGYSLACYLARQEERSAAWAMTMLRASVRERVSLVLARIAAEMGTACAKGHLLDFPLVAQALGAVAQVSRYEARRAVHELVADGVLQRESGRKLVVTDIGNLLGPRLLGRGARALLTLPTPTR
jgi:CRP-like cAMP-binding protein